MLSFYMSLPKIDQSDLYVKGYTESLKLVEGVRVVPDSCFISSVPSQYLKYFLMLEPPYYYIPVKIGRAHYGFWLKGQAKETFGISNYYRYFNLDALENKNFPFIIIVEGIKDAYLPLKAGYPTIALGTASFSKNFLQLLKDKGKFPIFIPDSPDFDEAGRKAKEKFYKVTRELQMTSFCFSLHGHKDLGDYFDPEYQAFVLESFTKIKNYVNCFRR